MPMINYLSAAWPGLTSLSTKWPQHFISYMLVHFEKKRVLNIKGSLRRTNEQLSHPSLGWLYVFSSFPRPRPQWLLHLMSKLFELNLRCLGQRKYRSEKMYWMAFLWPWPKVTAVALINKNWFVCRIKWEPLNQWLQSLVAISPWSCLLPY